MPLFLVFSCAAVIVFDRGMCMNVFTSEYVQPGVYLQMSVSLLCSCLYSQANTVL